MKERPLVSVITIFLNEERFLEEAIRSVRAQTYDEWELLLCDDGSTDASTRIARAAAEAQPDRIRYLDHPGHENRGMSATRNLGIAHARGTLLALLDADDVWEPQKLERQVELLSEQPAAAMVYGPSLVWYDWTDDPADRGRNRYRRLGVRSGRVTAGRTVLSRILRGRAESPGTCSVLIRTDAVRSVGGFEESFRGMFEDQAFFAKLFLDHEVYVSSESRDRYRQHPDSSCSRAILAGEHDPDLPAAARGRYLQWLRDHLRDRNADRRLRAVVARELWFQRHPAAALLRHRLGELSGRLSGRLIGVGFDLGRLLLPRSVRERLWNAWHSRLPTVDPRGATAAGRRDGSP